VELAASVDAHHLLVRVRDLLVGERQGFEEHAPPAGGLPPHADLHLPRAVLAQRGLELPDALFLGVRRRLARARERLLELRDAVLLELEALRELGLELLDARAEGFGVGHVGVALASHCAETSRSGTVVRWSIPGDALVAFPVNGRRFLVRFR
jgi:hypothetical protein